MADDLFPEATVPGVIRPFLHRGDWYLHDVIPDLLDLFGPCDVDVMTYNVSDESLRALYLATPSITALRLLLDTTVKRHKVELLYFAESITPSIRIDSCHAKVLLLHNSRYSFGIVGSANLNRAHRYESGFWFTAGDIFTFFLTSFERAYADALPYDVDL